jgi:16S rRNA (cytosine967-C5)-methyltransferase
MAAKMDPKSMAGDADRNLNAVPHAKSKPLYLTTKNPREAAYLAVLISLREGSFASELLDAWKQYEAPNPLDFKLAREIAFGTIRMALSLDFLAEKISKKQKLNLKAKEKVLMRTALYQFYYMDRIPPFAIVNETINIAKKYCHETFVRFLNASLRKISNEKPELPKGDSLNELSLRFSYPEYFVQELLQDFGLEKAISIMQAGNQPAPTMVRLRASTKVDKVGLEMISGTLCPMAYVRDASVIKEISEFPDYYIQNATPAHLIYELAQHSAAPATALDLCSSPGGKLIALHDIFPQTALYANDVLPNKIKTLQENCAKYGINAVLTCVQGENYKTDKPFDLVILDVPCSNSGVLNKRPEARWRISKQSLDELEGLQMRLLKNAADLISDDGEIWYMTCSILEKENLRLIEKACNLLSIQIRHKVSILPNQEGWDGGFACILKKAKKA